MQGGAGERKNAESEGSQTGGGGSFWKLGVLVGTWRTLEVIPVVVAVSAALVVVVASAGSG